MSAKFFADHDLLDIPDDPDLHVRWIKEGYSIGALTSYTEYLRELYLRGLLIPAFSYARYMPPEGKEIYKSMVNHNILPLAIRVPSSRLHVTSPKFNTGKWGEEGPHFSSNVPWVGVGTLHDPMPMLTDSSEPLVHVIDLRQYFLFLLIDHTDNGGGAGILLPLRTRQACLMSMVPHDPVFYLQQHAESAWELHDYLRSNGAPFLANEPSTHKSWRVRPTQTLSVVLPPEFIRTLIKRPMLPVPVRA